MNTDELKAITRRFTELVWNERDMASIPDLVTADITLHIGGGTFSGADMMSPIAAQWHGPFPDLHAEILQQVAEGDRVVDYVLFTGHHSGEAFHPGLFRARGLPPIPATSAEIEFTQMSISRLENGKIAEIWEDFDRIRLWMQLGVTLNVPGGDK